MLSVSDEKLWWYERETFVREVEAEFGAALPDASTEEWLRSRTFLVMKPDGIAAGRLEAVLEFVTGAGFSCVGAIRFDIHGLMWRELWRYQLTAATLDRLSANRFVLEATAVMLLLARNEPGDVPASVDLASMKGSATLELQRPGTLRHVLGQPNRVLSHVHLPDEPADVLRELGILLTREQRSCAWAMWSAADVAHPSVETESTWIRENEARRGGMSIQESVASIRRRLGDLEGGEHAHARALREQLDSFERGDSFSWGEFEAASAALSIDHWDIAVVGTSGIRHDRDGHQKLIGNVTREDWLRLRR